MYFSRIFPLTSTDSLNTPPSAYISLIELDVQGDKISVQPNLKTFKDEYKNEDHEENYDLEDVLDDTDEE